MCFVSFFKALKSSPFGWINNMFWVSQGVFLQLIVTIPIFKHHDMASVFYWVLLFILKKFLLLCFFYVNIIVLKSFTLQRREIHRSYSYQRVFTWRHIRKKVCKTLSIKNLSRKEVLRQPLVLYTSLYYKGEISSQRE